MRVKDSTGWRAGHSRGLVPEGKKPGEPLPGARGNGWKHDKYFACPSPQSGLFPPFQGTELLPVKVAKGRQPKGSQKPNSLTVDAAPASVGAGVQVGLGTGFSVPRAARPSWGLRALLVPWLDLKSFLL